MTPELEKLAKSLEWQPIETAPKDGTRILTCVAGFWPTIGYWKHEGHWSNAEEELADRAFEAAGYLVIDGEHADRYTPDHWMPLPTGNAGEVIRVLADALNAVYHRIAISRQMFDAGNITRDVVFQALPAENEARQALARAEQLAGGGE